MFLRDKKYLCWKIILIKGVLCFLTSFSWSYDVVELLPLNGDVETGAHAMNETNRIVGFSIDEEGLKTAVYWVDNGSASLSPVELTGLGGQFSEALGVNDLGEIVGYSDTANGEVHACKWDSSGGVTDLNNLISRTVSRAVSINEDGDIAGYFLNSTLQPQGFTIEDGAFAEIQVENYLFSRGLRLNHHGKTVISGVNASEGTIVLAFGVGSSSLSNLPGASFGQANALNDRGEVVGGCTFDDGSGERACLWNSSGPNNLGDLGGGSSQGLGLNNFGDVVGTSRIIAPTSVSVPSGPEDVYEDAPSSLHFIDLDLDRAFIWKTIGGMTDLNSLISGSDWMLSAANDINDLGKICGYGVKDGKIRGFYLKPQSGSLPTPEVVISAGPENLAFRQDQGIEVRANLNHATSKVRIYLDSILVTETTTLPFSFSAPSPVFGNHTIRVESLDSGDVVLASKETVVKIRDLFIDEWKQREFGGIDVLGSGDEEDPDGDTFNNLMEFAFNMDPNVRSFPGTLIGMDVSSGFPVIEFKRRKEFLDQGLSYRIGYSGDLSAWDSNQGMFTENLRQSDGPTNPMETLQMEFSEGAASNSRKFFRIEVTRE